MNIRTISTKEMREDFGQLRRAMQRGQSLVLLYRSKPLAEIKPIRTSGTKPRSFSQKQLKQWVADDQLSSTQHAQIDVILDRLSR